MTLSRQFPVWFVLSFSMMTHANAQSYGVNAYLSSVHYDDDKGRTTRQSHLSPFNFYYADKLSFSTRYWSEFYYGAMKLPAGTTSIGANIKYYGAGGAWQRQFRLNKAFKPWVGAGMSYVWVDARNRHTIDRDGFLAAHYANQSNNTMDFYFVASNQWQINRQWHVGVIGRVVPGLFSNLLMTSIGMSMSYR